MTYKKTANGYIVRLDRGDIFFETMVPLLNDEGITSAFFYGLGGAEWAELGLYRLDDHQYHYKYFAGPLEITNLSGNISMINGKHKIHAHATISGPDMVASGGHVKAIGIAGTCELYMHSVDYQLTRRSDEATGLELLDL